VRACRVDLTPALLALLVFYVSYALLGGTLEFGLFGVSAAISLTLVGVAYLVVNCLLR
jgi:hypothetical protein